MKQLITAFLLLVSVHLLATELSVTSPDGRLSAKVQIGDRISYSISLEGKELVKPSFISMKIDDIETGASPTLRKSFTHTIDQQLFPVVKQKSAMVRDHYNELVMQFRGEYSLVFRVYDDGAAWRWETAFKEQVTVYSEEASFSFPGDYPVYFPEEQSMFSHQERLYLHIPLSELTPQRFCSVPALADLPGGIKIAITEADLFDYPGMYLAGGDLGAFCLKGLFPAYPLKEEMTGDRDVRVTERAGYLAKTAGTRSYPWRVMVITEKDGELIESQMVYKLSRPSLLEDASWIRPGKVAWDWWNALNIHGVDFKSGLNTATYKYYIDFAADYQIEYIILDEGWYSLGDLMSVNPDIDMDELMAYAKEKNVGIILWVVWKTLWDQMDQALDQFEKWGVKGIKVDFMQRDDQWMVNYYWKVAQAAADRRLLVDFHGSYKPAGLHRTWPNVITREGVRGLEWNKWSDGASPENALTIPFTRMLAGPVDYTPGAMINATKEQFRAVSDKPMSQGTRCHQLAMYVIFESPLQMLADNPSHYRGERDCMRFLGPVPTVWDETVVLDAKVSDFVVLARRSGETWYIGAMTDWDPRDLIIDLSFLGDQKYYMTAWQDGANAGRDAEDFFINKQTVLSSNSLKFHLAPGGGFVAVLKPLNLK